MKKSEKPRVKFCWSCGRKLWGNKFTERKLPHTPNTVIMHKQCAEEYDKEMENQPQVY